MSTQLGPLQSTLVTGGIKGIGFEIALALAKARVLLLSRMWGNDSKTVATVKGDDPHADVKSVECDLGNLRMVKDVAERIRYGYYARSKLTILLFTKYGLVERMFRPHGDRILTLATHPGGVHTNQPEQMKEAYGKVLDTVPKAEVDPLMRSPEKGCLSTLWAATSPEADENGWNGKYFTEAGKLFEESKQAQDPKLGKNLWELSEKLITTNLGPDGLLSWDPLESYAHLQCEGPTEAPLRASEPVTLPFH